MAEQKEPAAMIGSIRSAAQNADILRPYLENVMAADPDERKKSATLHVFSCVCLLVNSGKLSVPERASDYIADMNGKSAPPERLPADRSLVPTFMGFRHAVEK